MKQIMIDGVRIDLVSREGLCETILEHVAQKRKARILNVNVHALNLAHRYDWFRSILNGAETVFCDGVGVQWAARLLRIDVPTTITYADWYWELMDRCARHNVSVFLLGSTQENARKAAANTLSRLPNIRISGFHHGYFDSDAYEAREVRRLIAQSNPDLVLVGMGMPLQERWIRDNYLETAGYVFLSVGACFDIVSGAISIPPRWVFRAGLHWVYRLGREPLRLFRRYVIGNPAFFFRILTSPKKTGLEL